MNIDEGLPLSELLPPDRAEDGARKSAEGDRPFEAEAKSCHRCGASPLTAGLAILARPFSSPAPDGRSPESLSSAIRAYLCPPCARSFVSALFGPLEGVSRRSDHRRAADDPETD